MVRSIQFGNRDQPIHLKCAIQLYNFEGCSCLITSHSKTFEVDEYFRILLILFENVVAKWRNVFSFEWSEEWEKRVAYTCIRFSENEEVFVVLRI